MNNKILVISHNPFCIDDNMGRTLSNLFKSFERSELCQLYFRNEICDSTICDNYYYINEMKVVKSIFNRCISTGKVNKGDSELSSNVKDEFIYIRQRKNQLTYLLRNMVWKLGKWYTEDLDRWIRSQKPSIIFAAVGDCFFLFDIVKTISKKHDLPIVTYHVDEYYFSKIKNQLLPIEACIYRKKFYDMVKTAKYNFAISEMMCKKYEEVFGTRFGLLTNPYINKGNKNVQNENGKIVICYYGNLSFNRWENILEIGKTLMRIKNKYKHELVFEVYSGEQDPQIIRKLKKCKGIDFKGKVTPQELEKVILYSKILIHTESFGKKYKDTVKYSLSTKIPELLSSGRIILCIGPSDIEPVDYLKRNHAAVICESNERIEEKIMDILQNNIDVENILKCAEELAVKNHSNEKNSRILRERLLGE